MEYEKISAELTSMMNLAFKSREMTHTGTTVKQMWISKVTQPFFLLLFFSQEEMSILSYSYLSGDKNIILTFGCPISSILCLLFSLN